MKRRVGLGGNDDLLVAGESLGAVVRDNPPVLNGVVLAIADIHIHIDIGIDGFQREGYAGGILGNFQLDMKNPPGTASAKSTGPRLKSRQAVRA